MPLYLQWFDMERSSRPDSKIARAGPCASAPEFWPTPPFEPSRFFWARRYLGDFGRILGPLEEELQTVFGERVLRVDHRGASARRMRNAGGKWVANITNEENKIAAFALVPSGAKAAIANIARGIRDRHRAGLQSPRSRRLFTSIKLLIQGRASVLARKLGRGVRGEVGYVPFHPVNYEFD